MTSSNKKSRDVFNPIPNNVHYSSHTILWFGSYKNKFKISKLVWHYSADGCSKFVINLPLALWFYIGEVCFIATMLSFCAKALAHIIFQYTVKYVTGLIILIEPLVATTGCHKSSCNFVLLSECFPFKHYKWHTNFIHKVNLKLNWQCITISSVPIDMQS